MKDPGFRAADPLPSQAPRERRKRHFPRSAKLFVVAVLMFTAFLGFLAFVAGVIGMAATQAPMWGWLALSGLGTFVVSRVAVFFMADTLNCPLCHGAVMKERRCRKHEDSFRLWPLSHRASAVLSLLITFGFRCMYCGTSYRLGRRRSQVQ
ncbi:MAG: hypothetical protein V4662_14705 [Verrucomicrobiota bacterium]